jgi:hypothetical protein
MWKFPLKSAVVLVIPVPAPAAMKIQRPFNPLLTMKKTILKTLILAVSFTASAAMQVVDISTLTTNPTHSSGWITIPGVCTNAPYTVTNPASVTIGDTFPSAFAKANTNFYTLNLLLNNMSNSVVISNAVLFNQLLPLAASLTSISNSMVATNAFLFEQLAFQQDTNVLFGSQITALMETNSIWVPLVTTQLDTNALFAGLLTTLIDTNALWLPVVTTQPDTNAFFATQFSLIRTNYNIYGAIAFPVLSRYGDPYFIYVDGDGHLTNTAALP